MSLLFALRTASAGSRVTTNHDAGEGADGSEQPIVEQRTTSNVPMQCFKMACADKNCIRRSVKQTNKFNYFWTMNSYEPWILYASMSILNYSKEITLIDAKLAEIEPSKIMLFGQKMKLFEALW